MTKSVYSSPWTHNTNAGFQAWGGQLSAAMQTCGLVQTADTGQINWATVTVTLTANAVCGYEIYHFNDTLQSTSPIFIKVEYGTGAVSISTNSPSIWLTVGTGSDGAGNITGVLIPRTQVTSTYAYTSIGDTHTSFPTYVCYNGSFLGVALKVGGLTGYSSSYDSIVFMVGRPTDGTGTYLGGKVAMVSSGYSSNQNYTYKYGYQTYRHPTIQCYGPSGVLTDSAGNFSCAWMNPQSTAVSGANFQTYACWGAFPQALPLFWMLRCLNSEVADGGTVIATPFGTTPHTYINLGMATVGWGLPQNGGPSGYPGFFGTMMLWE